MVKKDRYQWANYISALSKDEIKELIKAFKFHISVGIDVSRNEGYLEFAEKTLRGE